MLEDLGAPRGAVGPGWLCWSGRIGLALAIATTTAFFAIPWAIDAPSLGKTDPGLALGLALGFPLVFYASLGLAAAGVALSLVARVRRVPVTLPLWVTAVSLVPLLHLVVLHLLGRRGFWY